MVTTIPLKNIEEEQKTDRYYSGANRKNYAVFKKYRRLTLNNLTKIDNQQIKNLI